MATAQARFVRPEDLESDPLSPELVLVSPPAFAARARDRLPPLPLAYLTPKPRIAFPLPTSNFTPTRASITTPAAHPHGEGTSLSFRLWLMLMIVAVGLVVGQWVAGRHHHAELASTVSSPMRTPKKTTRTPTKVRRSPSVETRDATRPTRVRRGTVHLGLASLSTNGSRVPLLSWENARDATYYDLQVYRGQRKIYEAWPAEPGVALPTSWRFGGRIQKLVPGRYVWYVWPGFGKRADAYYGHAVEKHILRVG